MNYRGMMLVLLLLLSACSATPADQEQATVTPTSTTAGGRATEQPTDEHSAMQYLPQGEIAVEVMELQMDPRGLELAAELQQAAAEQPEWWAEHMGEAEPGEPPPYHPNMGISEEEYEEFLRLSQQLTLQKTRSGMIQVDETAPGIYTFDGGEAVPSLTGIVIDLNQDAVETSYGTADVRNTIKASPNQRATGPWNGVQWKLEDVNLTTRTAVSVQFALGELTESGRGILYYSAKEVSGATSDETMIVLEYDL